MNGATLDACVLIAALDDTNADHTRAVDALDTLIGTEMWVHPINLAEVLVPYAARSRADDRAEDITRRLRTMGVGVHDQADASHAIDLACVRRELGIKMPDACAVVTAWETMTPLLTFDARLAAAVRRSTLPVSLH